MPISCPLDIRPLTAEEFQSVDYRVMGHAFACQNRLGCLCEEDAYQNDLLARLSADGFESVYIEVPITVSHKDFEKAYFIDLVADNAVYELKTVSGLNTEHQAQLLNYLFLLGVQRGKLLNFRPQKVAGRIHATSLATDERYRFQIDTHRWGDLTRDCVLLRETMNHLLTDWGAFLDFVLFQQALTHFSGGEQRVVQRLPLERDGISLGTQRFHLHAPAIAFRVTAVTQDSASMETHFRRLLALTRLEAIQWINLNHAEIQFITIQI